MPSESSPPTPPGSTSRTAAATIGHSEARRRWSELAARIRSSRAGQTLRAGAPIRDLIAEGRPVMDLAQSVTQGYPEPLGDAALAATWDAAWSSLGCPAPPRLQADLMAAWSEPHRHHHDQRHLRECLALWVRWRDHCARPGEVAIALWFHDAVYDPRDRDNQLNSATWAALELVGAGADTELAQRVYDLVMTTRHVAPAPGASEVDAQMIADIDLAILGSPDERFEGYEQDLRREYDWLPRRTYLEGRARVLGNLQDRPRLYRTEAALALLERQARINLAAALTRLAQ